MFTGIKEENTTLKDFGAFNDDENLEDETEKKEDDDESEDELNEDNYEDAGGFGPEENQE